MKQGFALLILIAFLSCKQDAGRTSVESAVASAQADWLVGNWKRLGEEEGKETFEKWEKVNASEYSGIGFTMQASDTIKQEKIHLRNVAGKWELIVKTPGEAAVLFPVTSFEEEAFVCENPEIGFPNIIRYWKSGAKLKASVSNAELEIPFEFERVAAE